MQTIARNINLTSALTLPWWVAMVLVLLTLRLVVLIAGQLPLFFDEAYYHFWSLTPDWGYYSKPPMVAWLIALSTGIFGHHPEWAVKLTSPLLYCATSAVIYALARQFFERSIASMAALIYFTMPLVSFNSLFITTDAPLLFFWSLCLLAFVKAQRSDAILWYAVAGLAGGLGLLSKYTMAVLLVSLALVWLLTVRTRKETAPLALLAGVIALLLFLPNLWWNAQHDFISFQHTKEISAAAGPSISLPQALTFVTGQFGVFGPVSMGVLALILFTRRMRLYPTALVLPTVVMLSIILIQALLGGANANWAAPAYVTGSILVAAALANIARPVLTVSLLGINLLMAVAFYAYPTIQHALDIEPTRKNTPYHRIEGWRELMATLPSVVANPAQQTWISDSRKVLSYLHYYLPGQDDMRHTTLRAMNTDGHVADHFELLFDLAAHPQQQGIYVSETPADLHCYFSQVMPLTRVSYQVYPTLTRHLYLYHVSGFNGYENCD